MTGHRAVDLFCGAGGASLGLHDAGFDVVGFDYWPQAVETHNANGLPARVHDLSDPSLDDAIPECDLMWLSPPCQPFSAAGDGEGEFDGRDGFPWALRIIGKRLPPVAIIENVKGLTFDKHAGYFGGVLRTLTGLGYEWDWKVLNCADYGVPQTRERCIVVARRDGGRITWPMPTHTEQPGMFTEAWVTMADALGWGMTGRPFPTVAAARDSEGLGGSGARRRLRTERGDGRWMLNTGRNMRAGEGRDGATVQTVPLTEPAPTVSGVLGQWWLTRPATTVNGDPRVSAPGRHDPDVSGSQQADATRVSVTELARLQGFPDGWQWTGTKSAQARQIGNAVPPRLAEVIATANRPLT